MLPSLIRHRFSSWTQRLLIVNLCCCCFYYRACINNFHFHRQPKPKWKKKKKNVIETPTVLNAEKWNGSKRHTVCEYVDGNIKWKAFTNTFIYFHHLNTKIIIFGDTHAHFCHHSNKLAPDRVCYCGHTIHYYNYLMLVFRVCWNKRRDDQIFFCIETKFHSLSIVRSLAENSSNCWHKSIAFHCFSSTHFCIENETFEVDSENDPNKKSIDGKCGH